MEPLELGSPTILQVNTSDARGGAAHVATSLHHAYRARGYRSWLAVGYKLGMDPFTLPIGHDLAGAWWQRTFRRAENAVARRRFRGARWLRNGLLMAADPHHVADWYHGYEGFRYPNTAHLLDLPRSSVDVLHLHNLHGNYFDLRQLPRLTAATPTVLSLHDAWLLSGHCAHSLGCERWREGCGHCPDLTIEPAIRRDATAENWRRKRAIYAGSRYHIISPSQWLADSAAASPLAAGLQGMRVIPHGVDQTIFRPGERSQARGALSLPQSSQIVLMVANGMRRNPWKDFTAARAAFKGLAAQERAVPLLVLVIGDSAPDEKLGEVTIRYLPYTGNQKMLAHYYQAADLFLNSSKVEVWGLAITEALACGVPVVATAVGGTPEQVISWPENDASSANGILVQPADSEAMAGALNKMLDDKVLRWVLGGNAARRARVKFDHNTQVDRYLAYYRDIMNDSEAA